MLFNKLQRVKTMPDTVINYRVRNYVVHYRNFARMLAYILDSAESAIRLLIVSTCFTEREREREREATGGDETQSNVEVVA